MADGSLWPPLSFGIGIEGFDEAGWQRVAGGTVSLGFLRLELSGATMHYQSGGVIPSPTEGVNGSAHLAKALLPRHG